MAAKTSHPVANYLEKLFEGHHDRSGLSVVYRLQGLVEGAEHHRKIFQGLVAKAALDEAKDVAARFSARHAKVQKAQWDATSTSSHRKRVLAELIALASEVRALAAVLFRREPDLAVQFVMPRRKTKARTRTKPAVPVAPPAQLVPAAPRHRGSKRVREELADKLLAE